MNNKNTPIILKLLSLNSYTVKYGDLMIELESHPDFPSFKSISDTFTHLNVTCLAANIPKSNFTQVDQTVLVNVVLEGELQLAIAENVNEQSVKLTYGVSKGQFFTLQPEDFFKIWDGNLIALERNTAKKKLKQPYELSLFILCTALIGYQQISEGFNVNQALYGVGCLIGLLVSYLIGKTAIDPNFSLSKFCNVNELTDCNSVISNSPKVLGLFTLSDLCIVYFSSACAALLIKVDFFILAWLSILSLPVVVYSIYHQSIVIKKWCPLCLIISTILCFQFIASLPYLNLSVSRATITSALPLPLVFLTCLISWGLLKPVLKSHAEQVVLKRDLKLFKRNHRIFMPYFNSLPQLDTKLVEPDIHYGGDLNAPIQLLIISNPFCKHCIDVHHMLKRLLKAHIKDIGISYRFYLPLENTDSPDVLVSGSMLKCYIENGQKAFHQIIDDWHLKRDVNGWLKKYGSKKIESRYIRVLEAHRQWCIENGIGVTPIILVNNRIFPLNYNPTNLEHFIEPLLEEFEQKELQRN